MKSTIQLIIIGLCLISIAGLIVGKSLHANIIRCSQAVERRYSVYDDLLGR